MKKYDDFFKDSPCHRCGSGGEIINVYSMSWFTNEKICLNCISKENEIRKALLAKGIKDTMEGCGYVPTKELLQ